MAGISEQARAIRNKYYREYRKKNPDKVRQANDNYWNRKAEAVCTGTTEQILPEQEEKGEENGQ